jgi:phospholipase/carboxylesterase
MKPPSEKVAAHTMHALTIEHTAFYAIQEPETLSANPPLLIALHGYGQNCERFMRDFAPLRTRGVLVAAPQAPNHFYFKYDPPTVGFSWLTSYEKEYAIKGFLAYIAKVRDALRTKYPGISDRPFLLGYSQGVAMAHRLAARGGVRPFGLIACCADLPPDVEALLPEMEPFPVLLVHGKDDPLISIEKCFAAEKALRAHNYPVATYHFEGGHLLGKEQFEHIAEWITAQIECGCD